MEHLYYFIKGLLLLSWCSSTVALIYAIFYILSKFSIYGPFIGLCIFCTYIFGYVSEDVLDV